MGRAVVQFDCTDSCKKQSEVSCCRLLKKREASGKLQFADTHKKSEKTKRLHAEKQCWQILVSVTEFFSSKVTGR